MKLRIRWFSIPNLNTQHLKKMLAGMESNQYRLGSESGFQIIKVRADRLVAKHIHLLRQDKTQKDPLGKLIHSRQVEIRTTNFQITTQRLQLELQNPSRSYHQLLNEISHFLDYTVPIEYSMASCLNWLESIEKSIGPTRATNVTITSIPITSASTADIYISSMSDVRNQINRACGGRKGTVNSISFECARLAGTLESNCRAILSRGCDPEVISILHAGLLTALSD